MRKRKERRKEKWRSSAHLFMPSCKEDDLDVTGCAGERQTMGNC